MKQGDRVKNVRYIDDSRWDTIKVGMTGIVIHYVSGDHFAVEFDDYVAGQAMIGKRGHTWLFPAGDEKFFEVIESREEIKT